MSASVDRSSAATGDGSVRVIHILNSVTGGIGRVLSLVLPRMPSRGVDPVIVNLSGRYSEAAEAGLKEVVRHDLGLQGVGEGAWAFYRPLEYRASRRVVEFVRRLNPRVLHSHYLPTDLVTAVSARSLDVPHVVHIHGINKALQNPGRLQIPFTPGSRYAALLRNRRTFVAMVSDYLRDRLAGCGIVPHEQMVLTNGVDCRQFSPGSGPVCLPCDPHLREDWNRLARPLILFVGRLDPNKDVATAVRALGILARRSVPASLVVAGLGPLQESLACLAGEQGVADRVIFLGERGDVGDLLRACDVFCLPSRSEGMSMSTLEAMATGLPVVASDIPAMRVLVEPGRTGLLAAPGDVQAFAAALERLATDEPERRKMGQCGRDAAVERYSVDVQADALAAVYHRLAFRGEA